MMPMDRWRWSSGALVTLTAISLTLGPGAASASVTEPPSSPVAAAAEPASAAGPASALQPAPSAPRLADSSLLPAWDGSIDLYRDGVFTTQKSWLWCTAAGVQIVNNIVDREEDHSTSGQRRYFAWMRTKNHYDLPLSAGVDPQGWTAGLRHFVDDRYRLVASRSFRSGLRFAVANLRRTGLPVAITVSKGNHGWILTGFAATADPLLTDDFEVTSVRVVGPLFGLQSKGGYDMRPDTKVSTAQLRDFFTPWRYAPMAMKWDGRFVSIQPVAADHEPPVAWVARAATFAQDLLALAAQAG
jgi:hypothetical protein